MTQTDTTAINFQGLASGINTADIVEALVKVARIPIAQTERQSSIVASHRDAYTAVIAALKELQTAATAINRSEKMQAAEATVSDSTVLTASAGSAEYTSHTVEVMALARTQRSYSNTYASATTPGLLPLGSVSITRGLVSESYVTDNTTTLEQLKDAINNGTMGVRASVVNQGGTYRLSIESLEPGTTHAFAVGGSGVTMGLDTPANVQTAQNASVKLDGLAVASRDTNTINDLIEGVTLRLHSVNVTPQTVTVAPSTSGVADHIKDFVGAYNKVISIISAIVTPQEVKDAEGQDSGKPQYDVRNMPSDFNLNHLMRQLQSIVTREVTGADANMVSLGMIGISTKRDGTLAINETELDAKIADDAESVSKLFVKTFGSGDGVAEQISTFAFEQTSIAGPLYLGLASMETELTRYAESISNKEASLKSYEELLKKRFTEMEKRVKQLQSQSQQLLAMLQKPT